MHQLLSCLIGLKNAFSKTCFTVGRSSPLTCKPRERVRGSEGGGWHEITSLVTLPVVWRVRGGGGQQG